MGRAGRTSLATTARDRAKAGKGQLLQVLDLGKAPFQKSAVFLNVVQKAFDPPPFI